MPWRGGGRNAENRRGKGVRSFFVCFYLHGEDDTTAGLLFSLAGRSMQDGRLREKPSTAGGRQGGWR